MNAERKLNLIYLVLGIAVGVASLYLRSFFPLVLATVVYLVSFFIVKQLVKVKEKFSWFLINTLVTFVLIWLVTWILLYGLR